MAVCALAFGDLESGGGEIKPDAWIRRLYESGHTAEQIREAYRLLAWMMRLPKRQTLQFRDNLVKYQEEKRMPFITDTEEFAVKVGRQEGIKQGMNQGIAYAQQQAILDALELRLGEVPEGLKETIERISGSDKLRELLRIAIRIESFEAFARAL